MKHEEFLRKVKAAAEVALEPQPVCPIEDVWVAYWNATAPQEVLKLLAIIEKLKEQQRKMYFPADVWDAGGKLIYDKELDEIVGQP